MARKIKITSRVVKKTVLWALLVVLVVGAGILVVESFSNGHVSSNNTILQDLDYTGDYRLYLEKQLIVKTEGGDYDTIISDKKEVLLQEIEEKYDELKNTEETKFNEDMSELKNGYDEEIAEIESNYEKTIADIEASDLAPSTKDAQKKLAEEDKERLLEEALKAYEAKVDEEEALHNETMADLDTQAKMEKDDVDEEFVVARLMDIILGIVRDVNDEDDDKDTNEILSQEKTLTEVLKGENVTPSGYVYNEEASVNSAIKAEFDVDLTDVANTNGSVKEDTAAGVKFTYKDVEYVYSAKKGTVVYKVSVAQAGYYNLLLDYVPFSDAESMGIPNCGIDEISGGAAIERIISIDGEVPFDDLKNISFVRTWSDGGEKFIDATGNEIKPKQVEVPQRTQQYVRDSVGYVTEPYLLYFGEGEHTIEIKSVRECMGIAGVYLTSKENYQTYEEYADQYKNEQVINGNISYNIQGEGGKSQIIENGKVTGLFDTTVIRSSSTIYGVSDRTSAYNSVINEEGESVEASPVKIVLNSIGGTKWSNPGDWIQWNVTVKESGLYQISLRAKQNISRGLFSTRKLSIDGAVPFAEAMNCKFVYGSDWSVVTLGGEDNEEYYFYLEEGTHTITLECILGDYASQIARIQGVIDDLNSVYRKIIQRTGINPDPYMDYFKNTSGKKIIADATKVFKECVATLKDVSDKITQISGEKSSETASLETMAIQLNQFIKKTSKIQKNLSDFSTNISSLGTWILNVSQQSLSIDYIMVHSEDYDLPKANPNIFGGLWFSIKGFFGSFFFDYESVGLTKENEGWETIDVWLCTSESQGREQANAISAMISEACEDETSKLYGINVKLKVVSADVLLTATLAGRGPDIAINVANGTPVNYALRGATRDLTQFTTEAILEYFEGSVVDGTQIESFQDIALGEQLETDGGTRRFQYSAMTPYEFEGGYYALPYTQSYLMMFYRTDMFEEYGWDVPETWTDVIQLIPELQIMNFQFYLPLNTIGASSVVNQIFASYLYQLVDEPTGAFYRKGINAWGEEYIESNFDSEEAQKAFEFWCSFYTDYSFPLSASFVNRFRSGETPIGIVGYDMYNTLAVSAPEVRGKWSFALLPGTEKVDENGNTYVDHQGAASGMSLIMMDTTDNPFEAWAFMDWFTSADTQVNYAREIEAILGAAARHNTANVAAFTRLAWTEEEKEMLLAQWVDTVGVPEVAGGYYTGRNLENAFREVVNNKYNARQILQDYILTINSEIDRKREEFGLASSQKASEKYQGQK